MDALIRCIGRLVLACGLMSPYVASATVINPGDVAVPLSGTTVAASPDLAGTVLADPLIPFEIEDGNGNVILRGNLQDRVARSDNTGTMIFAPRLRDLSAPSGDAWIVGMSTEGYGGFSTDVDFRFDGLGDVGPNTVSRSAPTGEELFFKYDPNIVAPTLEGQFINTLTDAGTFDASGSLTLFAQNDFGVCCFSTTLEDTHAPQVVPLPPAAALLASGLLGLVTVARRRSG